MNIPKTISTSQLKDLIKSVIRECINEKKEEYVKVPGAPKVIGKIKQSSNNMTTDKKAGLYKALKPKNEAGLTSEAAYKVVAPTQARCSKCNQALTIQTEPTMTETAYKTQGQSAKTFDDSPQFPKAVNDPKNA